MVTRGMKYQQNLFKAYFIFISLLIWIFVRNFCNIKKCYVCNNENYMKLRLHKVDINQP